MNRTKRTLGRVAGLALVLSGAGLFATGQASANDRVVDVSCTDQTAGIWTVAVTFSAIEVKLDRPVQVTLGSESATLTEPSADGTVTLRQRFGPDQTAASLTWSVVRLDYQNMGVLNLDRPTACEETPTTEAPPTTETQTRAAPPADEVTPTPAPTVPATVLGVQVTPEPSAKAVAGALPETGRQTLPLVALGAGALVGGLGMVVATRRRPEQA